MGIPDLTFRGSLFVVDSVLGLSILMDNCIHRIRGCNLFSYINVSLCMVLLCVNFVDVVFT